MSICVRGSGTTDFSWSDFIDRAQFEFQSDAPYSEGQVPFLTPLESQLLTHCFWSHFFENGTLADQNGTRYD